MEHFDAIKEKDWLEVARNNPVEFEEHFADQISFFDHPIGEKQVSSDSFGKGLSQEGNISLKKGVVEKQKNIDSKNDIYIWLGIMLAKHYCRIGKIADAERILEKLKAIPSGREKVLQLLKN